MYSLKVTATEMLDLVQVKTTFLNTNDGFETSEVGEVTRRVEITEGARDEWDETTAFLLAVVEALMDSWFGEDAPAWRTTLEDHLRERLAART